jgi:hypothetical protein
MLRPQREIALAQTDLPCNYSQVEAPPPKDNSADQFSDLCDVLESLGYVIKERNAEFPPYHLFAQHKQNLPIIANLFNPGIEIACHWPCTQKAKDNHEAFAVFVNSMNVLCQFVTCLAEPETMTIRACYPFNFATDLFRAFMEAWMEDAADILAEIQRDDAGFLDIEMMH